MASSVSVPCVIGGSEMIKLRIQAGEEWKEVEVGD
jgi:hypothetical protein